MFFLMKHLDLVKMQALTLQVKCGAWGFAFLTSSQMTLVLSFLGARFWQPGLGTVHKASARTLSKACPLTGSSFEITHHKVISLPVQPLSMVNNQGSSSRADRVFTASKPHWPHSRNPESLRCEGLFAITRDVNPCMHQGAWLKTTEFTWSSESRKEVIIEYELLVEVP